RKARRRQAGPGTERRTVRQRCRSGTAQAFDAGPAAIRGARPAAAGPEARPGPEAAGSARGQCRVTPGGSQAPGAEAQPGPVGSGPVGSRTIKPSPVGSGPAEPDSVGSGPAEPSPVGSDSVGSGRFGGA